MNKKFNRHPSYFRVLSDLPTLPHSPLGEGVTIGNEFDFHWPLIGDSNLTPPLAANWMLGATNFNSGLEGQPTSTFRSFFQAICGGEMREYDHMDEFYGTQCQKKLERFARNTVLTSSYHGSSDVIEKDVMAKVETENCCLLLNDASYKVGEHGHVMSFTMRKMAGVKDKEGKSLYTFSVHMTNRNGNDELSLQSEEGPIAPAAHTLINLNERQLKMLIRVAQGLLQEPKSYEDNDAGEQQRFRDQLYMLDFLRKFYCGDAAAASDVAGAGSGKKEEDGAPVRMDMVELIQLIQGKPPSLVASIQDFKGDTLASWAQECLYVSKEVVERHLLPRDSARLNLFARIQTSGDCTVKSTEFALYEAILCSDDEGRWRDYAKLSKDKQDEAFEQLKLVLFTERFDLLMAYLGRALASNGELDFYYKSKTNEFFQLLKTADVWISEENEPERCLSIIQDAFRKEKLQAGVDPFDCAWEDFTKAFPRLKRLDGKAMQAVRDLVSTIGRFASLDEEGNVMERLDGLLNILGLQDASSRFGHRVTFGEIAFLQRLTGSLMIFFDKHVSRLELSMLFEKDREEKKSQLQAMGKMLGRINDLLEIKKNALISDGFKGLNEVQKSQLTSSYENTKFLPNSRAEKSGYWGRRNLGQDWKHLHAAKQNLEAIREKFADTGNDGNFALVSDQLNAWYDLFDLQNRPNATAKVTDFLAVDAYTYFRDYCNKCPVDIRQKLEACSDVEKLNELLETYRFFVGKMQQNHEQYVRRTEPQDIDFDLKTRNMQLLLELHAIQIYQRIVDLRQKQFKDLTGVDRHVNVFELSSVLRQDEFLCADDHIGDVVDLARRAELAKVLQEISRGTFSNDELKSKDGSVVPQSVVDTFRENFVTNEKVDKILESFNALRGALKTCKKEIRAKDQEICNLEERKYRLLVDLPECLARIEHLDTLKEQIDEEIPNLTKKLKEKKDEKAEAEKQKERAYEALEAAKKKQKEAWNKVDKLDQTRKELDRKKSILETRLLGIKPSSSSEQEAYKNKKIRDDINFEKNKLDNEIRRILDEIHLAQRECNNANNDVDNRQNDYNRSIKKINDISREIEELEEDLKYLKDEIQNITRDLTAYRQKYSELQGLGPIESVEEAIKKNLKALESLLVRHHYLMTAYESCRRSDHLFGDKYLPIREDLGAFSDGERYAHSDRCSILTRMLVRRMREDEREDVVEASKDLVTDYIESCHKDCEKRFVLSLPTMSSGGRWKRPHHLNEELKGQLETYYNFSNNKITDAAAQQQERNVRKENPFDSKPGSLFNASLYKDGLQTMIAIRKDAINRSDLSLLASQEAIDSIANLLDAANDFCCNDIIKWIGCHYNDPVYKVLDEDEQRLYSDFRLHKISPMGLCGCEDINRVKDIMRTLQTGGDPSRSPNDTFASPTNNVNVKYFPVDNVCSRYKPYITEVKAIGEYEYPFDIQNEPHKIIEGKLDVNDWSKDLHNPSDYQQLEDLVGEDNKFVMKHRGYRNLEALRRIETFMAGNPSMDIDAIFSAIRSNPADFYLVDRAGDRDSAVERLLFSKRCRGSRMDEYCQLGNIRDTQEISRLLDSCKDFYTKVIFPSYNPFHRLPVNDGQYADTDIDPEKLECFATMTAFMGQVFQQLHQAAVTNGDAALQERVENELKQFIEAVDSHVLGQPFDLLAVHTNVQGVDFRRLFEARGFALAKLHGMNPEAFIKDARLCGRVIHNQMMQRALLRGVAEGQPIAYNSLIMGPVLQEFNGEFLRQFNPNESCYCGEIQSKSLAFAQNLMELAKLGVKDVAQFQTFRDARLNGEPAANSSMQYDYGYNRYVQGNGAPELVFDCATYECAMDKDDDCENLSVKVADLIHVDSKRAFVLAALGLNEKSKLLLKKTRGSNFYSHLVTEGPLKGQTLRWILNGSGALEAIQKESGEQLVVPDKESASNLLNYTLCNDYICWIKFDGRRHGEEKSYPSRIELYSPTQVSKRLFIADLPERWDNAGQELKFYDSDAFEKRRYDPRVPVPYFVPFVANRHPVLESLLGKEFAQLTPVLAHGVVPPSEDILRWNSWNEDRIYEFPHYLVDGKPLRLREAKGKLFSAENAALRVYTQQECMAAIHGDPSGGGHYRTPSPFSSENPCIILGSDRGSSFLPGSRASFQLVYPFTMVDLSLKSKDSVEQRGMAYGSYGEIINRNPIANEAPVGGRTERRTIGFSIQWAPGRHGIMDSWGLRSTDPVKQISQVVELIGRCVAQKDYNSAAAWFQYLPTISPITTTTGLDISLMREIMLNFLANEADQSVEMASFKMRLLNYWLTIDLKADSFVEEVKKRKEMRGGGLDKSFFGKLTEAYKISIRDKSFIEGPFQFTLAEEENLLRKLQESHIPEYNELTQTISSTRLLTVQRELTDHEAPASTAPALNIRQLPSQSNINEVSQTEKVIFEKLKVHFKAFEPQPQALATYDALKTVQTLQRAKTLLAGENGEAHLEASVENEGQSQEDKTRDFYRRELEMGERKLHKEEKYVPENLDDSATPRAIIAQGVEFAKEMALTISEQEKILLNLVMGMRAAPQSYVNLENWAARFLLGLRRMEIRVQESDANGKALPANKKENPVYEIRIPGEEKFLTVGTEAQLKQLTDVCRSLLLATALANKNQAIVALADDLRKAQEDLVKSPKVGPSDGVARTAQLAAKWRQLNKEIESQKNMVTTDANGHYIYYGSVLERIQSGISREELIAFEAISGIRPRQQQADLLEKIFRGDVNAFQLIMGGGKTAVMLAMMSYFTACRTGESEPSVPVILGHSAQMESLVGSIGKEYKERFQRETCIIHMDRSQLTNRRFLQEVLERLQEAKKKHSLVLMPANDISKLELAFIQQMQANKTRIAYQEQLKKIRAALADPKCQPDEKAKYTKEQEKLQKAVAALGDHELYEVTKKVLSFFREETVGLIDEADSVLRSTDEVNFPQGGEKEPNPVTVEAIVDLASIIGAIGDPFNGKKDHRILFKMGSNEQDTLTPEQFEADVEVLVDRLWITPWPNGQDKKKTVKFGEWLQAQGFSREQFRAALRSDDTTEGLRLAAFLKEKDRELAPANMEEEKQESEVELANKLARRPYEYLSIVFGTVRNLLPSTLKKNANRGYGFTVRSFQNANGETTEKLEVAPYIGAGMPSTNSIASDNVKATYLIQMMLCEEPSLLLSSTNGSDRLIEMFLKNMNDLVLIEEVGLTDARDGVAQRRPVQELFQFMFGQKYTPDRLRKLLEARGKDEKGEADYQSALKEIRSHLVNNPKARLLLFRNAATFLLKSHPGRITSTSIDRCRYFKEVIACTGTTWNSDTWPAVINGERIYNDPGTEGCILIKMCKDIDEKKARCLKVQSAKIPAILDAVFGPNAADQSGTGASGNGRINQGTHAVDQIEHVDDPEQRQQRMRMFLDSGGLFKTITSREAAEGILRQMWARGVHLSGMVYFQKFNNRDGGEFRLLKPMAAMTKEEFASQSASKNWAEQCEKILLDDSPVSNLQKVTLTNAGVDPATCGAFLDETHTTGTDMPLPINSTGILTVDLNHTTIRDLTQAVMRFRQLLDGQSVSIVMIDSDETKSSDQQGQADHNATATATNFEEIIAACISNQADALKSQNLKSAMDKIRSALKEIVLNYVLDSSMDCRSAVNIFMAFDPFFVKESTDNPLQSYVSARTFERGSKIIYDDFEEQMILFAKCLKELQKIDGGAGYAADINEAFERERKSDGKLTNILQETIKLLRNDEFQAPLQDEESCLENDQEQQTDIEAHQEVQTEEESETDVQNEVDQEREALRDLLNELDNQRPLASAPGVAVNLTWSAASPHGMTLLPTTSIHDDMAKIKLTGRAVLGDLKDFGQIIPTNLFVSSNQRWTTQPAKEKPLNTYTKVPEFFLVSKDAQGQESIVVITKEEALDFKNRNPYLAASAPVAVYDMAGSVFAGNGSAFEPEKVTDARMWIHFYYGDFEALLGDDRMQAWIDKHFPKSKDSSEQGVHRALLAARWLLLWAFIKIPDSGPHGHTCKEKQIQILRLFMQSRGPAGLAAMTEELRRLLVDGKAESIRRKEEILLKDLLTANDYTLQTLSKDIPSDLLICSQLWGEDQVPGTTTGQQFWNNMSPKTLAVLLEDHPDVADVISEALPLCYKISSEKKALLEMSLHSDRDCLIRAAALTPESINAIRDIWTSFNNYQAGDADFSDLRQLLDQTGMKEVLHEYYREYHRTMKDLCSHILEPALLESITKTLGLTEETIKKLVSEAIDETIGGKDSYANDRNTLDAIVEKMKGKFQSIDPRLGDHGVWNTLTSALMGRLPAAPKQDDINVEFQECGKKYASLLSKGRVVRSICAWFFATILVVPLLGVAIYKAVARTESWAHSVFGCPLTKTSRQEWLRAEIFQHYRNVNDGLDKDRRANERFLRTLINATLLRQEQLKQGLEENTLNLPLGAVAQAA